MDNPSSPGTQSIELPTIQAFANLKNAKGFALDIGGSLTKLAYYTTIQRKTSKITESDKEATELYHIDDEGEESLDCLQFMRFDTAYIGECMRFLRDERLVGSKHSMKDKVVMVTGGGAYRYKTYLEQTLGVTIDKADEMRCLVRGCNFLLRNIEDESFAYDSKSPRFQTVGDALFPYLLVNIGSGVSIIKVVSETECERVGGTSLGGGSFLGLGSLLTSAKSFDELLKLADSGDNRNVDVLVKDIYGGDYDQLNLSGDLIACSFGKVTRHATDQQKRSYSDADIAKSLLITIANDIGQLAVLHARLNQVHKIYFGGYFLRGRDTTMHCIDFAVNFWSKGDKQALFLRHEGYLGAIGAFLSGVHSRDSDKYSWSAPNWTENYARSLRISGDDRDSRGVLDIFEMNRCSKPLVHCPLLLAVTSYFPDTIDLCKDSEARDYWLNLFVNSTDSYVDKAVHSQASSSHAKDRAVKVKQKFLSRLSELKIQPCAYGLLTVRSLLDTREQTLQEFHFTDPYVQQKHSENEHALKLLPSRLSFLESLTFEERQLALITGVLAGNVFDWGAKKIVTMFESADGLNFDDALSLVKDRPWLHDDYDRWYSRVGDDGGGTPCFKCAAIFVDNSGYDIVLGIFPLVKEFIERGIKVILCANSHPALNDVTYNELTIVIKRFAAMCPCIEHALHEGRLFVMENGQSSPCLDLRYIDYDLCRMFERQSVDLIIFEGMGRAIHTNLDAKFKCETLKIAVIKNDWLAHRLGGDMFSVICKYETGHPTPCS